MLLQPNRETAPSRRRFSCLLGCIVLSSLLAPALSLTARADASQKNVLVLYSFSARDVADSLEPLEAAVRSHFAGPVNFYVEYLESQRFQIPGYREGISETFHRVYGEEKIDLIVAASYPALKFAVDFRQRTSPGVPIVFISVAEERLEGQDLGLAVTGVTTSVDVRGTVDLAFRLHPDTTDVMLVTGTSDFERFWLQKTEHELQRSESRRKLNQIRLVGIPTDELLKRVNALPAHTLVFFQLLRADSSQPALGTNDILSMIAQRWPTYCVHNYCLDHGAVGGSYPDSIEQGTKGGLLAARVMNGEKPEDIPVQRGSPGQVQVDWRQLRHWNISETALPPGSLVLYRQPTVWDRYSKYIVGASLLVFILASLVAGLLWNRLRKQRIEAALRESEERFRVMADTTPSLIWMCDPAGAVTYLNDRWIGFVGRDRGAALEQIWMADVHPDDHQHVLESNRQSLEQREPFSKEYRLRRRDGVYRWILDIASPRVNGDGSFAGFIGSAVDVTDQKLAQEALENLSGRLLEAQEKERSRIGRELHDDICQRLTLLSMEIEQTSLSASGMGSARGRRLNDIQQRCSEIVTDVQSLSHQLHSSKLEYLGLVTAIRSFSREFSQQHQVSVEFTDENVPAMLSKDISLCLFRVVQEALQNAVKHSGADRYAVDLRGTADGVQLEVRDSGIGFDLEAAKSDRGLGLVSMRERIHIVHGTLSVESKPGEGTCIKAFVSTDPGKHALAAAAETT